MKPDDPPLDPFLVHTLTIRFEPRRQVCQFPGCKIKSIYDVLPLVLLAVPQPLNEFVIPTCIDFSFIMLEPGGNNLTLKKKKKGLIGVCYQNLQVETRQILFFPYFDELTIYISLINPLIILGTESC